MLEKAVRAAKGKVKLVKMNIDEHPAIPGQMGIQSIPAVIAFVDGQPADGFMGAVPESQVNAFIERADQGRAAPGEPNIAEILQEAEAVLAEGDAAAAAQIYAEVLAPTPPTSPRSRGWRNATSRRAPSSRPSRRSPWCRKRSATTPRSRPCRRRSISPSRPSARARDRTGTESRRKPARSSGAGSISRPRSTPAATGPRQAAHQSARDRQARPQVERDGARKQLVQFFEAWGGTDEATVDGRKRLSTILFS